ncbi:MAG: polymer-forming cytoskeletal protein [Vicinamibacterales bacterium]
MLIPLLLAGALTGAAVGAVAQPLPSQPSDPSPPPAVYQLTGTRLAVAQDVHVAANEEVTAGVFVVGGSLRVDGRVRHDIVVVGGDVHLGPQASVLGDVLLVGGTLIRDQGSRLTGRASYVSMGEWWRRTGIFGWRPRLEFGGAGRWLSLAATLGRVTLLLVLMGLMLLIARAPVARVGRAAAAEPFRAAVVGLAAEVLFLPVLLVASLSLGITIIGLPFVFLLIPFALTLATIALLLGYTALACRLGEWLEDRLGWRPRSAFLATTIGLLLIVLPTLVARVIGVAPGPLSMTAYAVLVAGAVAEFAVWTIGLGATLLTGFGRWNTTPPPIDARV